MRFVKILMGARPSHTRPDVKTRGKMQTFIYKNNAPTKKKWWGVSNFAAFIYNV